MIWQDVVIMLGLFGFVIALIPSIKSKSKPAKNTCMAMAAILVAISVSLATLNLWLSFSAEMLNIAAWLILYFQKRS